MKRIPNPSNVNGTIYKIIYKKYLEDEDGSEIVGRIDPCKGELCLLSGVHRILKEKTWFHEILHGICKEINLKLTEKELDTLANMLHDTMHRNHIDCSS